MKFMSGLASLLIELYIYCYAFNYIEIAVKDKNKHSLVYFIAKTITNEGFVAVSHVLR
jgi:hypothetical protein